MHLQHCGLASCMPDALSHQPHTIPLALTGGRTTSACPNTALTGPQARRQAFRSAASRRKGSHSAPRNSVGRSKMCTAGHASAIGVRPCSKPLNVTYESPTVSSHMVHSKVWVKSLREQDRELYAACNMSDDARSSRQVCATGGLP